MNTANRSQQMWWYVLMIVALASLSIPFCKPLLAAGSSSAEQDAEQDGNAAISRTLAYGYEVDTTDWQCGTQEPAANVLKARFVPDNANGKLQVTVAKCDGSPFNSSGEIRIIYDDTREFRNWQYHTSTTDDVCANRVSLRLLPYSGDFALRGTASKCDGSGFTADGDMYIAADGNIIAGPDPYLKDNKSESITFTPLLLNTAGRHTYQAYLQPSTNAPGDYIISGAVTAWEEYHSYLSDSWNISAGQYEYSFSFDPAALGITGWHPYQIHYFPAGQDYPIRSGIISAREIEIATGDAYEPDSVFAQSKPIGTDGGAQTHTIHLPGDADWVRFDAQAGYQYVIETFNLQGGADTYIGLFWDDNNDNHADLIVADDNSGGGLASRITWTAPRTGPHYVKVRDTVDTKGGTDVAYSLRITAAAPSGDAYEPDSVFVQSKPIGTDGGAQTHTIHTPGDADWVRFDAQAGYQYVIETFNLQGGADTYMGLFWDDNNDNHADLIVADDNSGGGLASRITWTAPRTGPHYVKVRDTVDTKGGTGVAYNIRITAGVSATKPWTFMLYLAGDNNLGESFNAAIKNLEAQPVNSNVSVVVLSDGPINGDSRRFLVQPDGNYTPDVNQWQMGELNMGDPQTLLDFITWSREHYPAQFYYLAIADHGRGTTGIAWDDSSASDYLSTTELGSLLQSATNSGQWKIDVLHLDACLMAMLENAYQVKDHARYLVAYENLGWSVFAYSRYAGINGALQTNTPYAFSATAASVTASTTPEQLARGVADTYFDSLANYPRTVSAFDLSQIGKVQNATNALAAALRNNMTSIKTAVQNSRATAQKLDSREYNSITDDDEYVDLYHLAAMIKKNVSNGDVQAAAQGVMDAVSGGFVLVEHHASGLADAKKGTYWDLDNTHGVAVYFPPRSGSSDYVLYTSHQLFRFTGDSTWDDFLSDYFGLMGLPPDDAPEPGVPPMPVPASESKLYLPSIIR